ncbi:YlbF family regulator [Bacillus sp. DJP31]|uniref:YlbF family regulator n=1 Tax=Bacillus sp. DJP31 TaxID=3409789 RepID=UPI003BB55022
MASNYYDVAYELEKAVRESNEYQTLKKLYDDVNSDKMAKQLFDQFRDLQMDIQQKQMSGIEITQEEMEHAQQQVALVQKHELIAKLMEAEQRMSMVIGELNRIIMKPLDDLYGPMQP